MEQNQRFFVRHSWLLLLLLAIITIMAYSFSSYSVVSAQATTFFVESFETDGQGIRYTASTPFNDGASDHWNRTDGSDISNITGAYTGFDGTFFWAAEDVNDNGGNGNAEQTLDIAGIDITGQTSLNVSILVGAGNESDPGASNYDAADYIRVQYSVDNAGFTNGVCFGYENFGDDFNEPFGLDADCSGESDVNGTNRLGTALQNFSFDIPETGNTLDLKILVSVDSGNEEIAFDYIRVSGESGGISDPGPTLVVTNSISNTVADNAILTLSTTEGTNVAETLFIHNDGDTNDLTVSVTRDAGSDPQLDFVNTPPTNVVLGPNATSTVYVECDATTTGSFTADFDIINDDPDGDGNLDVTINCDVSSADQSAVEDLFFNEILPDPNSPTFNFDTDGDGTAETNDEFVELYNPSPNTVDMSGWEIWDRDTLRFTFPANTLLGSGNFVVVVGSVSDGSLPAVTGGNLAFATSSGLALNNGGDNVFLYDPVNEEFIQILYNGDTETDPVGGIFPPSATRTFATQDFGNDVDGVSLAASPDGATNYVSHNTIGNGNTIATPGDSNIDSGPISAPYVQDFESACLDDFFAFSVDADTVNTWYCDTFGGDTVAVVNAFGDTAAANDWLISPFIDFSTLTDPVASFEAYTAFGDGGITDPEVRFMYSNDYSGTGDPSTATWVELPYAFPPEDSRTFLSSGEIDLSGVPSPAYFAWHYTSSGTGGGSAAQWEIDDFVITESTGNGTGNDPLGVCGDGNATLISTIQGNGLSSPDIGSIRTIEGIVTADFQNLDEVSGFFVQEEESDYDADSATSEGIFVYSTTPVSVGDKVRVRGTVEEYFDNTQIGSSPEVVICSSGETLPAITQVILPLATSQEDYEPFEGMLVNFPQELTVGDVYNHPRFGQAELVQGGVIRSYTQDNLPSIPGLAAYEASLDLRTIILDDASGDTIDPEQPTTFPFQTNLPFDSTHPLPSHSTVVGVTGVIYFSFSEYRLFPTETFTINEATPPTATPVIAGNVTVSSFNIENWFNSTGTGTNYGGRGASNDTEFNRQRDKIIAAMQLVDADVFGINEMENEDDGPDSALARLVDELNAVYGAGVFDYVQSGTNGTDEIKVAIIYKATVVAPVGAPAVNTDPSFVDPNGTGTQRNRPALLQTFTVIEAGNPDLGALFNVAVVHFKSKGSAPSCPNVDCDQLDGQGAWASTRAQSANALADWLATDPTASGDPDFIVLGDFNSYAMEDTITNFEAKGFTSVFASSTYSYQFNGQFGTLDYAFVNDAMLPQVAGSEELHVNSDFSDRYTWNDPDYFSPNEYRSSDHDPSLISLDLTVPDTVDPVVTCPAAIVVNTDADLATAVVNFEVTATDDQSAPTISQTMGLPSGSAFPIGVTVQTFVATDASDNTDECSFMVVVNDEEVPTITCPADIVVTANPGETSAVVTYDAPVANDNAPGVVVSQTMGLASGASFPIGTTTNGFTATDASDNTAGCGFDVTVNPSPISTTITVVKVVDNTAGGTATVEQFQLFLLTPNGRQNVTSGEVVTVDAGIAYTAGEDNLPNYVASYSGACDTNGVMIPASGDALTCTITNTYVPDNGLPAPTSDVDVCWIEDPNGNTSAWQVTNNNPVTLAQGSQAKVLFDWWVVDVNGTVLQSAQRWDQTGQTRINTALAHKIIVEWYVWDNGVESEHWTVEAINAVDPCYPADDNGEDVVDNTDNDNTGNDNSDNNTNNDDNNVDDNTNDNTVEDNTGDDNSANDTDDVPSGVSGDVCWKSDPNGNTSAWQITNDHPVPLTPGTQQKVVFDWAVYDEAGNVLQSAQRWDQTGNVQVNTSLAYKMVVEWYVWDNGVEGDRSSSEAVKPTDSCS